MANRNNIWVPREDQRIPLKRGREGRLLSLHPYPVTVNICKLNLDVTKEAEIVSMTSSKLHKFSLQRADFEEILPCLFLTYSHFRNCTQCSRLKAVIQAHNKIKKKTTTSKQTKKEKEKPVDNKVYVHLHNS